MEELRFVRREDDALIVATEADVEFRLIADEAVIGELRQLSRRGRDTSQVRPREIQQLIRAGKSRAEVAELTGLEEIDIERYEEPVLAERRYILELAQAVPVRTSAAEEAQEEFGAVISERLVGLGAEDATWRSWRDAESGWMIGLDFVSHDVDHHALWSFDHRKNVLSPNNSEAVTLSKQGEVGERLIPKLRAVDSADRTERFEPEAFHAEGDEDADGSGDAPEAEPNHARHGGAAPNVETEDRDVDAEYARRREIDQRAISTTQAETDDLGQTADLLDALRRRRGEREQSQELPLGLDTDDEHASDAERSESDPSNQQDRSPVAHEDAPEQASEPDASREDAPHAPGSSDEQRTDDRERTGRRRRASIPSWDDILFGTRSEDDPA